jgi:hypothetical protein
MHLVKYNSREVLNSKTFQHHGVILTEFSRTKEYKPNTLIYVDFCLFTHI